MVELDPWYVTGFCDGEAAFTYSRGSGSFALYFGIKQSADNVQIIEDIQSYFGYIGKIYKNKSRAPTKNSGHTKDSVYYRVTRNDELPYIVAHFDKYPLQSDKKRQAYEIWHEMVKHKVDNVRNTDYDILRLLAEKLSKANIQSRAFKRHIN